jgi:hypothetical protein
MQWQNDPNAEEINFKRFRKLLRKSRHKSITIDIDSSVVNVAGHQVNLPEKISSDALFCERGSQKTMHYRGHSGKLTSG